jgi:peptidoglycan/LPS O-acetylase OafA/YrhL
MRALAASSVLLFHVWSSAAPDGDSVSIRHLDRVLPDLSFGVILFFTLSGFLLYRPFVAALVRSTDRQPFRAYLRNRALRIVPAYVVILLLCALVLRSVNVRDATGDIEVGGAPGVGWLATNLLLIQNYTPSGVVTGIGPAWSLAVEVVFYLALPFLVLLGALVAGRATTRAGKAAALLVPPLLMLVVGLAGKASSTFVGSGPGDGWGADWSSVLERSFLCNADLFAFGMALAVARVLAEDGALRVGAWGRGAIAVGALGTYAVTATSMVGWDQLTNSPLNTVMALSCALLLAVVVLPPASPQRSVLVRVLETRPVVFVGLISYSVFLWHLPVIHAMRDHGLTQPGAAGLVLNAVTASAVTLVLATLTYRFVEEPALRRKRSMSRSSSRRGALREPAPSVDAA